MVYRTVPLVGQVILELTTQIDERSRAVLALLQQRRQSDRQGGTLGALMVIDRDCCPIAALLVSAGAGRPATATDFEVFDACCIH